jgi:hypothetical protein
MITLEDSVGLCGLTEEDVLAIAEHEHVRELQQRSLRTSCPRNTAVKKFLTLLSMIFGKRSSSEAEHMW